MIDPPDPQGTIHDCLLRARSARTLLSTKVDEGDTGAYGHWLVTIAEQAVASVPAGSVYSIGGEEAVSAAEHRFVHRLAEVLRD